MSDGPALVWRKSPYCDTSTCVEVAETPERVYVRNSRDPQGAWLTFSPPEWAAFVAWLRQPDSVAR